MVKIQEIKCICLECKIFFQNGSYEKPLCRQSTKHISKY